MVVQVNKIKMIRRDKNAEVVECDVPAPPSKIIPK